MGAGFRRGIAVSAGREGTAFWPALASARRPGARPAGAPQLDGGAASTASYYVTEILEADPSQDRVLLRAPGLEACRGREEPPEAPPEVTPDRRPAPAPGEALLGLRARDGYRPRI